MAQTPDNEQGSMAAAIIQNNNGNIESDQDSLSTHSRTSYDLNYNSEEEEEKQRLINQVLTLQKLLMIYHIVLIQLKKKILNYDQKIKF